MQYDFSLNANGGQNIDATGAYVKYKSGLGAIRVKFSTGGYVDLTPGQGIRLKKQEFNSLNLTDKSGNANQGVLVIGDVEFQDDTIVGVVSIVDGGKNNTLSQSCFLGNTTTGTVASNYNLACLINDSSSGKNVIVESVSIALNSAAAVSFHRVGISPAANNHAQNKYAKIAGEVASKAFIESNITTDLNALNVAVRREYIAGNQPRDFKPAEPLIIPPGMALVIANNTLAAGMSVNWEFREDPL
ncbi:hypothetical protein GTP45_10655 [Pseudoduganella sp. FT55W]|uniref:Uncharacterized protein n=1 Tax=Duganella rivi TaxID=2666083 RepID=A0A7X4GPH2_9BURK|nr:hypothetical protein [Duganella rivi]MYM67290.1 hypothetical protein [Duganella rivi]